MPFKALSYTAGELNYGGRITDDKDRRLCMCILSDFHSPAVLQKTNHKLSQISS